MQSEDKLFYGVMSTLIAGMVGAIALVIWQGLFLDAMNHSDVVACQQNRMIAVEHPLIPHVDCVPAIERQDTTTVNLES